MDLEGEWNALADRYATPLLRHEWFAAAFDAFGTGCDLAIHVVRDGGRMQAIAPFVIERGLVSRLVLLGHQTFEPSAILHDDGDALQRVLHRLQSSRLPLFAPRLARGSAELRTLACGPPRRLRLPRRLSVNASASVPLGSNWPAFEAQMSKQSRTYIRRKRKAAEREGAVRVEVVAPLEAEVERHLAEFIRVEGAGWKSREGTSLQRDARMRRFCTGYAKAAARNGMLRMFFLRVGQHTAAGRIAVEHGGRLWEFKIGYDREILGVLAGSPAHPRNAALGLRAPPDCARISRRRRTLATLVAARTAAVPKRTALSVFGRRLRRPLAGRRPHGGTPPLGSGTRRHSPGPFGHPASGAANEPFTANDAS